MLINKSKIFMCFIFFIGVFFFVDFSVAKANEIIINQYPVATDITYGQPLYMSSLSGGSANVDGAFVWDDEVLVLEAGVKQAKVNFVADEESYGEVSFFVDVKVNLRRVYLKFEDALYKIYDGGTSLILPNYTVVGIVDKDVSLSGEATAALENGFVGENVKVNITGLQLVGARASNYFFDLNNIVATVYPDHVVKFGEDHKVVFVGEIHVPISSTLSIEKVTDFNFFKKGYKTKNVYDIDVKSGNSVVDVDVEVLVKLKLDEISKSKKILMFNYYNGEYEELNYNYDGDYLVYTAEGLGMLVIIEAETSYWWLYSIIIFIFIFVLNFICIKKVCNRQKINKYKSLKRRNDYGNC